MYSKLNIIVICFSFLGCGRSTVVQNNISSCTVNQTNTGAIINCPDGSSVPISNGIDAIDGTLVTPVKLCTGTTSYPNVFVEYAFCIENKLYGVYSVNGGFMSYLPDGTYSSNAIGSACTLTVNACNVSH